MADRCAWCDEENMDWNASFNGKDICADCEEDALELAEQELEEEG